MKLLQVAAVYLSAALGANAALAQDFGPLEGDMRKLVVHSEPREGSDAAITDPDGAETTLADYEGRVVLLNFWATWCAPCRHEMPSLDALNQALGGEDFAVVPVATGRNSLAGIEDFFAEEGIESLPILLDPRSALARDMAVLGLPVTVLLDREGREIARLTGDAEWNSDVAQRVVRAVIDAP